MAIVAGGEAANLKDFDSCVLGSTSNFVLIMSGVTLLSACWQNVLQSFQAVAALISPSTTVAHSFSSLGPPARFWNLVELILSKTLALAG